MKTTHLVILLIVGLALPVLADQRKKPQEPQENKSIPPDILRQMDPDLRFNRRPKIIVLALDDIYGLRENPRPKADLVRFGFEPSKLTTAHRRVLDAWIRAGHRHVYLLDGELVRYRGLFGLVASHSRDGGSGRSQLENVALRFSWPRNGYASDLSKHKVNTDCKDLCFSTFSRTAGKSSWNYWRSYYYFSDLEPKLSTTIVHGRKNGQAVCGAFTHGRGTVYFAKRGVST